MGTKLYVANLPFDVAAPELRRLFEPFGAVRSADVVLDRITGRSRGFGFVDMETAEGAAAARAALHGRAVGGRELKLDEARERAPGGSAPMGGFRPGAGPAAPRPRGGFHGGGGFRPGGGGLHRGPAERSRARRPDDDR